MRLPERDMREQGARLACALLLFLLSAVLPLQTVQADEFLIEGLQARAVDGIYLMDAAVDYRFSDEAFEALASGVPLTLELHVQLRRDGAWIWESDLVEARLRFQILHQALHGLYQVTDLSSGTQHYYATRKAALTALGRISDVQLIQADKLEKGERYRLSMRARLDIEALPLPLRPMAYLSPAWNLSSEWSVWYLQP
ncbi:MAG: DUF4390 domain-containing protein [Sedimenticola sp.]|uniref:DUF4390 domain-containing protein n=1 Tax=Sedimenticola thiotaurini TaxID=1543721 RepID=A0A558DFR1_9GAMM|nr:DUF4390 domain-containing protein [Sedimenticola sp.]MCW8975419.1 DUF4390 domain-containing protein [Sedimenticola sp.]MDF1530303.1 DUF4390 domain-containing protein [Sedimenticola sp.]TVT59867.1 MAG: DUF4390 domain-containing protein [Sedimenticola thiotaurini]